MRKFIASHMALLTSTLIVFVIDVLFFELMLQPNTVNINPGCFPGMLCDLGNPQSNSNFLKLLLGVDFIIFVFSYVVLKLSVYIINLFRTRFKGNKK